MNFQQELDNFSNNLNPSKEDIANAYYARDLQMGLNFQNQFDWAMRKLGYHPSTYQNSVNRLFQQRLESETKDFLNDPSVENVVNFQQVYNQVKSEFQLSQNYRRSRWEHFSNLLDSNEHHQFYLTMESSELGYLGF